MAMKVVTGGIAAAAVLMAMFVITPDVSVAVAYAGVRESLEKVTSISFVATTKGKAGPEQTKMTLKGRNKVRADRPHDEVSIFDHETKKMMIVYPRLRKAEVIQFEGPLGPSQVNLYEILTTAEGRAIEKLGERKFDDRAAVGYRVRDAHKVIWDVWVAPDTQLPIRMEAAGANNDGTVLSDFKYDELIDDSLFDMTPPEGFEVTSRTQNVEAEIKRQREEAEKNVRDAKNSSKTGRIRESLSVPRLTVGGQARRNRSRPGE